MNKNNELIEGVPGFDWDLYENDGTVKNTNEQDYKPYSRTEYVNEWVGAYKGKGIPASKELQKNTMVSITDFSFVNGNTMLAAVNGGVNNVVIDLNKEQKFFNILSTDGTDHLDKESFVEKIKDPVFKSKVIDLGIYAKIGTDTEKASIWGGYVENLSNEFKEQIRKKNKAYMAKVISTNNGGFVVEVADTISAFMPGSVAAANKISDYESLVGKTMEVMIESYDKKLGFIVSRKKYLHTILPARIKELEAKLAENRDYMLTGTVTGTTQFGIFVELDEVLTGMIHKTLMDDELRDQLRRNEIKSGMTVNVYVQKIEKGRIILSNVPYAQQAEVIKKREAEDMQEKATYMNNKREAAAQKAAEEAQAMEEAISEPVAEQA